MDPFAPIFKALGDATRLRVLRVLLSGAFNVNELVGILDLGQSRASRHLKILLDAGLVSARREGSWVYYTLSDRWSGSARTDSEPGRFLRILAKELDGTNGASASAAARDRLAVERCLGERRRSAETFFRDVANDWDSRRDQFQGPSDHLNQLVSSLQTTEGTIVDLGTGTGVLLERLSSRAERVIGVDAAAEMLDVARANVASSGIDNVDLRLGTLEHLPLPDGEADVMVANMVLHHVAHPPDAIREIHRGLREGGRVLVADFLAHGEESYRERLGDLWLGFEPRDIERWLDEGEFDIEDSAEMPEAENRPGVLLVEARKR
jgi:ArsR family transcriptional regulator